ncbi:flagellar hook-basal body complex protein FliE [Geoalkalibacter subterraneus]|uniref:Flagellar hook-basal body complex protein FliE n=1 Tax=Geoalkalibacter subterraneus TaxID=483547 RepID=A0A0B5FSH3_9BACT|nr:flagellar hook-basal body complex protein FliE [Geoalkalibacter subterraneus]AJF07599.1 hypothetical protein GSUB_15025 [Geoalkalibacter subterraneus]
MPNDITLLTHLRNLNQPALEPQKNSGPGFGEMLKDTMQKVNNAQVEADRQVERLHTGQAKNLHEVMISMEQADISLRLMVQMRNKVTDAYQEVMRMQV